MTENQRNITDIKSAAALLAIEEVSLLFDRLEHIKKSFTPSLSEENIRIIIESEIKKSLPHQAKMVTNVLQQYDNKKEKWMMIGISGVMGLLLGILMTIFFN